MITPIPVQAGWRQEMNPPLGRFKKTAGTTAAKGLSLTPAKPARLRRGEIIWLRLTTASAQCLRRLLALFHYFHVFIILYWPLYVWRVKQMMMLTLMSWTEKYLIWFDLMMLHRRRSAIICPAYTGKHWNWKVAVLPDFSVIAVVPLLR